MTFSAFKLANRCNLPEHLDVWRTQVQCQFLEIHNDEIRDLLQPPHASGSASQQTANSLTVRCATSLSAHQSPAVYGISVLPSAPHLAGCGCASMCAVLMCLPVRLPGAHWVQSRRLSGTLTSVRDHLRHLIDVKSTHH